MSQTERARKTKSGPEPLQWNVLTTPWLETIRSEARLPSTPPLRRSANFQTIVPPPSGALLAPHAADRARKKPPALRRGLLWAGMPGATRDRNPYCG